MGGVEKIKNLLGGSLLCAVPRKGEGVYAARRPFVNVTNITHTNETIYYILHYDRSHSIVYILPETPSNATKTHLHGVFCPLPQRIRTFLAKTAQNVNKDTYENRKTKHDAEAKPTRHAHNVRRHGKTTSENGIEAAKRSGTEKAHTETGKSR